MLFLKFVVAVAVIHNVLSCPASKKTNLNVEEVEDYHRQLSQIIGVESQRLAGAGSQLNVPQCFNPLYAAPNPLVPGDFGSRGNPALQATQDKIQLVYEATRTAFYALVDNIQSGTTIPAPYAAAFTSVSADPLSLFPLTPTPPTAPSAAALTALQKAYRVANLLGNAIRLVFHDAGELDIRTTDKFGLDGCLSDTGPNSGLKEANTVARTVIEPIWQLHCDKISRADFWVLFGKIAAESALPNGKFPVYVANALAGGAQIIPVNPSPYMPYLNIPFQFGRPDADSVLGCDGGGFRADGKTNRLPGHQPGLSEFTEVYVKQMGLTVRDGVILSGAHTVGHVHTQFSGFGFNDNLAALEANPTTNAWDESPWEFDNLYYDSLAGEFWLNNAAQANVIQNQGGNTKNPNPSIPANTGNNHWGVQVAPGVLQPVPTCLAALTCGIVAVGGAIPAVPATTLSAPAPAVARNLQHVLWCKKSPGGAVIYPTATEELNPAGSWALLPPGSTNALDFANGCNCLQFLAIPALIDGALLNARGCATAPHPKTIMLNADMVQNFPISGKGKTVKKNLVASGTATGFITDLGTGDIGEICGPVVVNKLSSAANGILNANELVKNTHLVFPAPVIAGTNTLQGWGCVKNTVGNAASFVGVKQQQNVRSTLLAKDPNNVAVSLFATVQSFMTAAIPGAETCINGISTYNNPLDGTLNPYTGLPQTAATYATYGGSVAIPFPTPTTRFIGQTPVNGLPAGQSCVSAIPSAGEGRDNFYREFEVAWVKMVTAGFSYSHSFNSIYRVTNGVLRLINPVAYTAPGPKLGALVDIVLKNPRQRSAHVLSGANMPAPIPNTLLPFPLLSVANPAVTGMFASTTVAMSAGPLLGSSTCYLLEPSC